jgi:DNA-binding HxlR family transcriptional regulator
MNSPRIGSSARGSRSGRPIMVALDALGRRGALRLLWELRNGPLTFRALQAACDTNPGSLNTRLKELRQLCIVDHGDAGYFLTDHGRSLMVALEPLQTWAQQWAADAFDSAINQTGEPPG